VPVGASMKTTASCVTRVVEIQAHARPWDFALGVVTCAARPSSRRQIGYARAHDSRGSSRSPI
jgi:hypothetical protein